MAEETIVCFKVRPIPKRGYDVERFLGKVLAVFVCGWVGGAVRVRRSFGEDVARGMGQLDAGSTLLCLYPTTIPIRVLRTQP